MHAPKRTTELISARRSRRTRRTQSACLPPASGVPGPPSQPDKAPEQVGPAEQAHPPPAPWSRLRRALEDTDRRGGGDGQDGARGDGLLGVPQVSRAVGASHDAWGKRGQCHGRQSCSPCLSKLAEQLMLGTMRALGMARHRLSGVPGWGAGTQLAAEQALPWLGAPSPLPCLPSTSPRRATD